MQHVAVRRGTHVRARAALVLVVLVVLAAHPLDQVVPLRHVRHRRQTGRNRAGRHRLVGDRGHLARQVAVFRCIDQAGSLNRQRSCRDARNRDVRRHRRSGPCDRRCSAGRRSTRRHLKVRRADTAVGTAPKEKLSGGIRGGIDRVVWLGKRPLQKRHTSDHGLGHKGARRGRAPQEEEGMCQSVAWQCS